MIVVAPTLVNIWRPILTSVAASNAHIRRVFAAVVVIVLGASTAAQAQLAVNATIESDFRLRGVSLTNGKPDATLGVSYDHDSGLYGGVSGVAGEGARGGVQGIGYIAYLGYAARTNAGPTLDFGVTNSSITDNLNPPPTYIGPKYTYKYDARYSEAYFGVIDHNVSARLYYSPNYLSRGLETVYADLSSAIRPADWWRLFGHVGVLTPIGGSALRNGGREQFDARIGAAVTFGPGEVQLAWTGTTPEIDYPVGYRQKRQAVVLSVSGFF